MLRLSMLAPLLFIVLGMPPLAWSAPSTGGHDCVKQGKQGYRCVKGPFAGQTFPSRQAMVAHLRKGSGNQEGTAANGKAKMKSGKGSAKKPS